MEEYFLGLGEVRQGYGERMLEAGVVSMKHSRNDGNVYSLVGKVPVQASWRRKSNKREREGDILF